MSLIIQVEDTYYPKIVEEERTRYTVRGIVMNEKNEVCLLHIETIDDFGIRNHYELPGGGIEKEEDPIDALKREIVEEIGYSISDIHYIGDAKINYHILKRWDASRIYICRIKEYVGEQKTAYEMDVIQRNLWIPLEEIEKFYASHPAITVGDMIHKRDLALLREAIHQLR